MTGLSARELLAALRSVPPELPAGQVPVYVTDHGWTAFELLPGCKPRVVGEGLLVIDSPLTVEQWEALSIEVHAREYPVLYVVGDQKNRPAKPTPNQDAPSGRRRGNRNAQPVVVSP
jgi:hypothetical protein